MGKYFFVLGRYPQISLAEIQTVLKKNNLDFPLLYLSPEIAVFSIESAIDLPNIFQSLGGSIKFGKILAEVLLEEKETKFNEFFEYSFLKENVLVHSSGKVHFGISIYSAGSEQAIISRLTENLKNFNIQIKENLKKEGISSGFLRIKDKAISSVAVEKNELINKGFELCLIAASDRILIGKTVQVQDFESFVKRDILRPAKDKRSGILPVKLARMMINLLPGIPQIILDPFCGSGTVLTEAALMGIKNLIAADLEKKATEDTGKNLDWLIKEYNLNKKEFSINIKTADARNLDKVMGENITDSIVTEPLLGPPLFRKPDMREAQNIISRLTPLYRESLLTFYKVLKKEGSIVMIFPFILTQDKDFFMDKKIIDLSKFKIRNSLLYTSPGQFVGRQITVLEKI